MLSITLITLILAIPLSSISAVLLTRITSLGLVFAAVLSYNNLAWVPLAHTSLDSGLGMYSGLIHSTTITQYMEVFMLICGALILLPWATTSDKQGNAVPTINEYPMIILFTTLGGTFLMASADLVSMYLAIELQSFGVYILSALYRDSESATSAGLKYFLLGALSSALILLGSALVYGYTGLTNLNMIYEVLSVPSDLGVEDSMSYNTAIMLGFIIISIGLLFKVASAPFHYWAPDVYDGTPTIVTTWLTVMPKISIFVFMLDLYAGIMNSYNIVTNLLLVCAFLSLVIGTVLGLGQFRIKRLMAYSTISHVGFLLLALAVSNTTSLGEESMEAFLFYIVQYSITNIDVFFVLLAFGYLINISVRDNPDVEYISELQGQFMSNPVLGLSLAICLFSMAGVPPLVGFFAKYTVLYSAIHGGYLFMAILAILASVVSAAYYLRVIRVVHFDEGLESESTIVTNSLSSAHSYIISVLTLFIMTFALNPSLLLNSTSIMALSFYTS